MIGLVVSGPRTRYVRRVETGGKCGGPGEMLKASAQAWTRDGGKVELREIQEG